MVLQGVSGMKTLVAGVRETGAWRASLMWAWCGDQSDKEGPQSELDTSLRGCTGSQLPTRPNVALL